MNIVTWLLAGLAAGWFSYSCLRFNARLGLPASLMIGAGGGLLGGALLGSMLGGGAVNPADFNPLSLFVATATGLACLTVFDLIQKRFGG